MIRQLSHVLSYGIELRLWVAICVTALCAFEIETLAVDPKGPVLLVIFSATLGLYNLDGSLDAPRRGQHPLRLRVHVLLTVASLLACLLSCLWLPPKSWLFVGSGLALCGFYALPLSSRGTSVKRVPYVKAAFVGGSVASATVGVPLLACEVPLSSLPWGAALWLHFVVFLGCTHNAILFDVADVREDRQQAVPTLPQLVGLRSTRWVCVVLVASGVALTALAPEEIPSMAQLGLVALFAALGLGTFAVTPETKKATVALAIDGALIFPWAMITLGP